MHSVPLFDAIFEFLCELLERSHIDDAYPLFHISTCRLYRFVGYFPAILFNNLLMGCLSEKFLGAKI